MSRSCTYLLLLCTLSLTGCGSLNFEEFTAPDGSYSVKMPGKPVRSTKNGGMIDGEAWEVLTSQWAFSVLTIKIPGYAADRVSADTNAALDRGVQGLSSNMRATQKSVSNITLNGFNGREVEVSIPAGASMSGKNEPASTAIVRFYLVNSNILMLMVRSTSSITKETAEVRTFYDSFRLTATNTSSSPAGGSPGMMGSPAMAGMPGAMPATPGTTPAAMPAAGAYPAAMPSGTTPAAAPAAAPPGYPVAGAATGAPPPSGYTGANAYPAAAPAGSAYPMPAGGYTPPAAGAAVPGGVTPMPGSYPAAAGVNPPPAGTAAAPMGAYPNANAAAAPATGAAAPSGYTGGYNTGGYNAGGFNNPGVNNSGTNPAAGTGQPSTAPVFTGTPVSDDTKISVGDQLQFYFSGQWVDVKVIRVGSNGMVQIRSQTKPPQAATVPRSALQFPEGAPVTEVAGDPPSDSETSGLPNSTATAGLPNSGAAKAKPRSTGFSKPAPEPKPEATKGPTYVSLDGASVDELLKIVAKKTEHRRVQAAEKLRDHSDAGPNPDVAKKLLELMQTDQLTVKNALASALEKWACPEINDAALKNLKGGTTEIRQSMMRILAANFAPGHADGIANCLADSDDRKVATETLLAIGAPAQEAVVKMLGHRDSKTKLAACEILKEIGTADTITAFNKATASWTGTDRSAARKTLKAIEARK